MKRVRVGRWLFNLGGWLLLACGAAMAQAQEPMPDHQHHVAATTRPSPFVRSEHEYVLPNVTLRDQAGRAVSTRKLQTASGPLAVNFIFTTCTTICPVMTATFAQMRRELGPEGSGLRMVSITIDPEYDSPSVLAEYAQRFDAAPGWSFLTGTPADVEQVVRAFDAWTGSKATHRPVTLLRRQGSRSWIRLDGLGSGAALADQARAILR